MNSCVFGGRLTGDVVVRDVKETCVGNFSIAINKSYKKSDGSWGQKVSFADCVIWDKGAKNLAERFKKGDVIYVEASLETDSWKDEEGKNRSKNKFRVHNFSRPVGFKRPDQEEQVENSTEQQIAF